MGVGVGLGFGVGVGEEPGVGVGVGLGEGPGVGVGVGFGFGEGLGVGFGEGDVVALAPPAQPVLVRMTCSENRTTKAARNIFRRCENRFLMFDPSLFIAYVLTFLLLFLTNP